VPARIAFLLAFQLSAMPTAVADDAARISRLETEIQQLRTRIDEQARRIQRLEDDLNRRTRESDPQPRPRPRVGEMRTDAPQSAARQPWHAAAAWDRVANGMTAEEVTRILGEPTSAESIGALKTLFYRGAAPGGSPVSGHVNFKDGRVVAIRKPAF
jgi:hypothetical protein